MLFGRGNSLAFEVPGVVGVEFDRTGVELFVQLSALYARTSNLISLSFI